MTTNRLGQKTLGRLLVPLLGKQKINGLAGLIDGTLEIVPVPFDLDVVR
jgi:hypothetical protein